MIFNARTWHWFCVSAYLIFPAILCAWFLSDGSLFLWPVILVILWGVLVAILGAIQGIMFACGKLYYGCPKCDGKSFVSGWNRDGIYLDCPNCGELRFKLGSLLGLRTIKIGSDEDETAEFYENTGSFLSAAKRHFIPFCVIFFPVVASVVIASVIHRFQFFYILIPGFWCYAVGGFILDGIYSGRASDNHGTAVRSKSPIRFWGKITIWSLAYLFAAASPIGVALQESEKDREVLTQSTELAPLLSHAELTPLLAQAELEQLGFKGKALRAVVQSDWDQQQFGFARIVEQDIKSLKPMANDSSLFPRYTLIRETYENDQQASSRLERLRDHDPELNNKMNAGLVLRGGFVKGKDVWILTTDAVIFSRQELEKVLRGIKNLR